MQKNPDRTTPISVRVNFEEWEMFKMACRKEGLVSATTGINILIGATIKNIVSLRDLELAVNNEGYLLDDAEMPTILELQKKIESEHQQWSQAFHLLQEKLNQIEDSSKKTKLRLDLSENIAQVNLRLTLCKVKQQGNRLYIRATLPTKDGTNKKSQLLKTGTIATPEGLHIAEGKAKKLESDLMLERFNWSDWNA